MRIASFLTAAALVIASIPSGAQTANKPLISHTFEDSDGGWTAMGATGKVSVTHDPANVHQGKAALKLDYAIQKGELAAMTLPVEPGALTKAKSFRFWIRADSQALIGVMLQEQDGGRYSAMFTVQPNQWQQVELAPADFFLNEDANDPKDPDGKLDLDRVANIGIVDVGQILAQGDNEQIVQLFRLKRGPHTLLLDDFVVDEEATASSFDTAGPAVRLDTLTHPQMGWFCVGGVRLSIANSAPVAGRALEAAYSYGDTKIVGIMRRFARGRLEGAKSIAFDAASTRAIRLIVQVEEKDGGKYNTIVDVPAGKASKSFSIPLKELIAADDSKDANNALDLDQIQQVIFIDMTGLAGGAEANDANTLWIGSLRIVRQ